MLLSYDGWQFFHSRNMGWTCTIYILDYVVAVSLKSVLVFHSCQTLSKLMDCSPPGSSAHGMLQARILEGVVIPLSRWSSLPTDTTPVSCTADRFFIVWATRKANFTKNKILFLTTKELSIWIHRLLFIRKAKHYMNIAVDKSKLNRS